MSKPLPPRPDQGAGDKRSGYASPPAPAKPAKPERAKVPKKPSPWPWGPWRRGLVSLLVAFHVLAVFAAPWFIQLSDVFEPALPPGRVPRDAMGRPIPISQLSPQQYPPIVALVPKALASGESKFPIIFHYANLLHIYNGYDFFSPDPSYSTILRYEVRDAANQTIVKGEFPNRREQWPRLLYHRYMMLVDQSKNPDQRVTDWDNCIADWLIEANNGATVHVVKLRHHLLMPQEVTDGHRLNEDSTYEVLYQYDRRADAPPAAGGAPGSRLPEPRVAIPGGGR